MDFVEAGQLRRGERVRTRLEEVAAVVGIKPRPPTEWVYNLGVAGEHVYSVGPGGILVHNACTRILEKNMRAAGYVRGPGQDLHHILPPGRFSGRNPKIQNLLAQARQVLKKHGIDLDSHYNGVYVDPTYHKQELHTNDALEKIATSIIDADKGGKAAVLTALQNARREIQLGIF